jgi:hypothetical protein
MIRLLKLLVIYIVLLNQKIFREKMGGNLKKNQIKLPLELAVVLIIKILTMKLYKF